MNSSYIELDEKYMEQVEAKDGLEYDTDDSNESDIPEEH